MTDADWDDMILVGIVARTHGNRGQVIVNSESDFPEARFRLGAQLFARVGTGPIERLEITSVRFQQGRPILGMAGFGSIDEAERLAGAQLRIPASEQEQLPEGSYYHHQLVGLEVVTKSGESIGRVTAVEGSGEASRLVVRGQRRELLIPLAQEICRVDLEAKRVLVTPPEGLLEIGSDWRSG